MRFILSAASAIALAACSPQPASDEAAAPAETAAPAAADAHAGMDDTMKSADATDDANTAETPEGYMFHTYPAKVESVHLPTAAGNTWTATPADTALVDVAPGTDEAMPDGSTHHVVKLTPKASGNTEVKFERRATSNASDPVLETRTVKLMIH